MKTKNLCLVALMSTLITVGAFIRLPISIVPITFQTLFVILNCYLLKNKAIFSILLYIFMGLIGLPVFTNGGGIGYILMPSFGYLIGFILCAYFIGNCHCESKKELFFAGIIGIIIIYIIGVFYFVIIEYFYYHQIFSITYIFVSLFLIYLPGDILSIILAITIYDKIRKHI